MASQNENGVFGEILERLYRAATGEARWECVFAAISESTSSNHAFYQEQDYPTGNTTRLLHDAVPLEAFDRDWTSPSATQLSRCTTIIYLLMVINTFTTLPFIRISSHAMNCNIGLLQASRHLLAQMAKIELLI
jgi:hypothetical protein